MKKRSFLLLTLILTAFWGCYDDKGNYKYDDIKELVIVADSFASINVSTGDLVTVTPQIIPAISEDDTRYTYRWYIDKMENSPQWTTRNFSWVADRVTEEPLTKLVLEITDTQTGVKYFQSASIDVSPAFYASSLAWIILSDNDSKSQLNFIRYMDMESRPDPVDPSKIINYPVKLEKDIDVFASKNSGESLGNGPISVIEHFVDDYGSQYIVFQQSGARDIDGRTLTKDINLSDAFENKSYPADFGYIVSGNFMQFMDAVTDTKGRIYTRFKQDNKLYHSGAFAKEPVKFENEILENCHIYRAPYIDSRGAFILDKENGRMLFILEGGNGDSYSSDKHMNAGKVCTIPDKATDPQGLPISNYRSYADLKNCEIYDLTVRSVNWACWPMMFYKDNSTGKFFVQETYTDRGYQGAGITNKGSNVTEITGLPRDPDKTFIYSRATQSYVFVAVGNELYLIDVGDKSGKARLYFTADSKITAIHGSQYFCDHIAIGTEGGWFYDLDTANAKNKVTELLPSDEAKVIYKSGGFGKIVDLKQRYGINHQNFR